jgi:Flp pilus assembly protein TadD
MKITVSKFLSLIAIFAIIAPFAVETARADAVNEIGLGVSAYDQGLFGTAVEHFTEALNTVELSDPGRAEVLSARAGAHVAMGNFDSALLDYAEAIKIDPKNASIHSNRGVAQARQGNFRLAVANYRTALGLKPDDPDILNNRCWAYANLNEFVFAQRDCDAALEFAPEDPNNWHTRGFLEEQKDDRNKAVEAYCNARKYAPRSQQIRSDLERLGATCN